MEGSFNDLHNTAVQSLLLAASALQYMIFARRALSFAIFRRQRTYCIGWVSDCGIRL
jgi:hypothetical protein